MTRRDVLKVIGGVSVAQVRVEPDIRSSSLIIVECAQLVTPERAAMIKRQVWSAVPGVAVLVTDARAAVRVEHGVVDVTRGEMLEQQQAEETVAGGDRNL